MTLPILSNFLIFCNFPSNSNFIRYLIIEYKQELDGQNTEE